MRARHRHADPRIARGTPTAGAGINPTRHKRFDSAPRTKSQKVAKTNIEIGDIVKGIALLLVAAQVVVLVLAARMEYRRIRRIRGKGKTPANGWDIA